MFFLFLIAENGAISYFLDTKEKTVLGADWAEKAKRIFAEIWNPHAFCRSDVCDENRIRSIKFLIS